MESNKSKQTHNFNPNTTVNTQLNIHNHGFPISAEELERIKAIDAALIPLFMEYVKEEQKHRHATQSITVDNDAECIKIASKQLQDEAKLRLVGVWIAFILIITTMVASILLIVLGYGLMGSVFSGVFIVSIIGSLVSMIKGRDDSKLIQ